MLLIRIDFKRFAFPGGFIGYGLLRQVHLYFRLRILENRIKQFCQEFFGYHHRQHKIVQLIIFMNIGKKATHHHPKAIIGNGPRSMLTARTRTEILSGYQNLTAISRIIQYK